MLKNEHSLTLGKCKGKAISVVWRKECNTQWSTVNLQGCAKQETKLQQPPGSDFWVAFLFQNARNFRLLCGRWSHELLSENNKATSTELLAVINFVSAAEGLPLARTFLLHPPASKLLSKNWHEHVVPPPPSPHDSSFSSDARTRSELCGVFAKVNKPGSALPVLLWLEGTVMHEKPP